MTTLKLNVEGKLHEFIITEEETLVNVNGYDVLVQCRENGVDVHENSNRYSASQYINNGKELVRFQCRPCGALYHLNYSKGKRLELMVERRICFTCSFWYNLIERQKNNNLWWRINGESYVATVVLWPHEKAVSMWGKGHGGREFCIKANGDSYYRTDNLWHQGTMPEWALAQYPNNAEFISTEEYREIAAQM
jgi:hypothetical protein